jgi:hypothetical protein
VLLEIQLRGVGGNQLETQSNSSWGIFPREDTPKGRNAQRKKGRRREGEKGRRGEGEKGRSRNGWLEKWECRDVELCAVLRN